MAISNQKGLNNTEQSGGGKTLQATGRKRRNTMSVKMGSFKGIGNKSITEKT